MFGECCGPLLDGAPAPSAERLMRSRYTAFAVGDAGYLVRTWHPRTRPSDVDLDGTVWEGLVIEEAAEEGYNMDESLAPKKKCVLWRAVSGEPVRPGKATQRQGAQAQPMRQTRRAAAAA